MIDLFIADAHLRHPEDENYRKLVAFLEGQAGNIRTLYLLGDIFEFWLGFRTVVYTPHVPLLSTLQKLKAAGTKFVYVEGNHDFQLGPFFENELECHILPDGGRVEIDGRQVYLAHGDLVDPNDTGYRLLRWFWRCGPVRLLSRIVHPDVTWRIASWSSRHSKGKKRERRLPLDLLKAFAEKQFAAGCDTVITGHFHAPHYEKSDQGTLIALGDWISQYSYVVLENGEFRLQQHD